VNASLNVCLSKVLHADVKIIFVFLVLADCFFAELTLSQQQAEFLFESFSASIENRNLSVFNNEEELIYQKEFYNPLCYKADLDLDLSDELLVKDSVKKSGSLCFTLYVFNTLDTFYLADSIDSGEVFPFETEDRETGEIILVCGNPSFTLFNQGDSAFLPLNCFRFSEAEVYKANDEVYDIFISANDAIIKYLDEFYNSAKRNCTTTEKIKPAIAAAYVNYINAGENSVANQFLKNYYLCKDINQFKDNIMELIEKD
jgi:hypothetical protein